MKHTSYVASLILLMVSSPYLSRSHAEKEKGTRPETITVPFELLRTKHMAVKIKINGKGPYRVIFDTGAPINLINNKVAKESGLIAKNAKPGFFNLFGSMGQTQIKSLELGDLKAEKVAIFVMDHPTVELISKVLGPIEGIIGFPFFARYKMALDYQAKQLTFTPNDFEPPDVIEKMMATVMALMDNKPAKPIILSPSSQWGLVLKKDDKEKPGVTIQSVWEGSAAAEAGLKAGDRLLTLDGRWTDSVEDAYRAAGYVKLGKAAKLFIRRGDQEMELRVQPRAGL